MPDSLFTALRSYVPTPGRDPGEDFLTEAFCWLLHRHVGLGHTVARALAPGAEIGPAPVVWTTQIALGGGRVDLVADAGN